MINRGTQFPSQGNSECSFLKTVSSSLSWRIDSTKKSFTAAEFEVLKSLAAHPGWVYSRQQIMEHLWDGKFYGGVRTADVHVRNIRRR
jgi:DNA-binding response OmpR family regulator